MLKQRTLKILDWSVHTPHQYELAKIGHNFYYLKEGERYPWRYFMRPKSSNCYFIIQANPNDFDLIIAHNPGQVKQLKVWKMLGVLTKDVPLIYMFHFCPGNEEIKKSMANDLQGYGLVFNSYDTQVEWNMPNRIQRVIIHGFDIDEWPVWKGGTNGVLNVAGAMGRRANVTGYKLWTEVAEKVGTDKFYVIGSEWPNMKDWQKRRVRETKDWEDLKNTLQSYDVYFSPTLNSPFPRATSEAFVTGVPMVCTSYHNSNIYIQHGTNGYICDDSEGCAFYINELLKNKELRIKFSKNARETASEVLSGKRYRREWRNFIQEVLI